MFRSLRAGVRATRAFHSLQHPEVPILDASSTHYQIMDKAITEYVPELGFQHKALLESARSFGYSDSINSLFTNGTYDLIKFHLVKQRLALHKLAKGDEFNELKGENDKLKYLLVKRLEGNIPVAQHLVQLQGYLILPPNIGESANELHNLSDDLRFFSGDRSNDFAWYSKRLALSSTYVGLELFMSSDKSAGYQNTLSLAREKVDEMDKLGKVYDNVGEWLSYTAISGVNLVRSQAARG